MSEHDVIVNVDINTTKAMSSLRQVEMIIFRAFGLWNRFCRLLGVPDDSPLLVITERIQRVTMMVRQLHTAVVLFNTAMSKPGVLSVAMAAVGVGTLAISVMSDMQGYDSGRGY